MHYIIWFDASAIFISITGVIILIVQGRWKDTAGRFLMAFMISGLIAEAADIVSALILNGSITPANPFYTVLVTDIYLLTHTFSALLLFCYFVFRLRISRFITDRKWMLYGIPYLLIVILVASNSWTGLLYQVDDNGIYSHNRGMMVLYAIALFYLIFSAIQVQRFRDSFSKTSARVLHILMISTLLSIIWESFHPEHLIELYIQAIASVGLAILSDAEKKGYLDIGKSYYRRGFIKQLSSALTMNGKVRIVLLKLPDAQYYNAVLGYENMHQIRKAVTGYLNSTFGSAEDRFFSCGNGNYARIFYGDENTDEIAERIRNRFHSSWTVRQGEDPDITITFPAEICVIHVPDDAKDLNEILRIVDARYDDKYGMAEVVSPSQVCHLQHQYEVEKAVQDALNGNRYEVCYQVIWNARENRADHAEALTRIRREDGTVMMPEEFIPVAEHTGIIMELGFRVFEDVCRFISSGEPEKHGIRMISVNLSAVQCMDVRLAQRLTEICEKWGVAPYKLNLEITETAVFNNMNLMRLVLKKLQMAGFSLTMDDYGTGYSNFTYILEFPFNMVKLDKSLLGAAAGEYADIILEEMITMLGKMNYVVVTEGVETREQKERLDRLGTGYLQGFYFARALPPERFLETVDELNREYNERFEKAGQAAT